MKFANFAVLMVASSQVAALSIEAEQYGRGGYGGGRPSSIGGRPSGIGGRPSGIGGGYNGR